MTSCAEFFRMTILDEESDDNVDDGSQLSIGGTYVLNNHKTLLSFLNVLIIYNHVRLIC
jgi:hypothetical protein